MGVLFTIIMMVVMGKFTWRKFFDALTETVKFFTFMFVALMAAIMFASTIAISQLPQFIADYALTMVESPVAILYMVILIFIIAGFFLENFGMVLMLVPLFFPVITQAGYDPVYFGVIMVMMMEVGLLTPPAAPNIYVAQYVDGEASVMQVINGSLPFYFTVLGLTVLLVHFPMIAMWLPGTMRWNTPSERGRQVRTGILTGWSRRHRRGYRQRVPVTRGPGLRYRFVFR